MLHGGLVVQSEETICCVVSHYVIYHTPTRCTHGTVVLSAIFQAKLFNFLGDHRENIINLTGIDFSRQNLTSDSDP